MKVIALVVLLVALSTFTQTVFAAPTSAAISREKSARDRIELITQNPDGWFARYDLINGAKQSLTIHYYMLHADPFGLAFLGLLHRKLKQGVKVKLMLDFRGSVKISTLKDGYLEDLVAAGAEVHSFNPFVSDGFSKDIGASDHQKLLIVDDKYFMTGGRNIATEYFTELNEYPLAYNDTDVLIESPTIIQKATDAFYAEWSDPFVKTLSKPLISALTASRDQEVERSLEAMEERMTNATLSPETAKEFPELEKYPSISAFSSYVPFAHATNAELTFETNTSHLHGEYGVPGRKDINQTVIERIHGATKFVLIMDSYIILMDEIRDALIDAGKRGVKVVFVTNSPISVDTLSTQIVFDQEWPKMLREIPGSEIFASKLTHDMHSKVLCFDETVCAVGSYNLDFQSGNLNSEDMVFIRSNELNAEVRRAIDDYAEKNTVQYSLQGDEGSNQLNVSEGRRLQLELLAPVGENLRWRL